MPAVSGMVVQIDRHTCIILTPDGDLRKIPLPAGNVCLGQEVVYTPPGRRLLRHLALVAASVLILLGGFLFYRVQNARAVAAYVSMDINPSVEVAVNYRQYVCRARGLNADGDALLSRVAVVGRPLAGALADLIRTAAADHYLQAGGSNVILATVTPVANRAVPSTRDVLQYIDQNLQTVGINAEVVVDRAAPEVRQKAQQAGLSPGRYLLQEYLARRGINLRADELKQTGMSALEREKHFKLSDLFAAAAPGRDLSVSTGTPSAGVRITTLPSPGSGAAAPPAARSEPPGRGKAVPGKAENAPGILKKKAAQVPGETGQITPAPVVDAPAVFPPGREKSRQNPSGQNKEKHDKEKLFWRQNRQGKNDADS